MNDSGVIPVDFLLGDPAVLGRALRLVVPALSERVHVCVDAADRVHLVAEVSGNRARLFHELGRVVAILRGADELSTLFPGEDRMRGTLEPAVHLVSLRAFPREPFLGLGAGTIRVVRLGGDLSDLRVRSREQWFDVEDRTPEPARETDGLSAKEQLFFEQLAREYRAAR